MAIREIVKLGDETLRIKCKEVTDFNARLGELIDDMYDTMFKAEGVGLAAPQIGIVKRIVVVCTDGLTRYELVNPIIIKKSGTQCGYEGCLSVPNQSGKVERPKKLTVKGKDRYGIEHIYKVEGYTAVAFSHEFDHLDGVLFIDKVIN